MLVILLGSVAVFCLTRWSMLRGGAALVIAAPLFAAAPWSASKFTQWQADQAYASGRGYFTDPAAQALAEAVVPGDLEAVRMRARMTDINQLGAWDQIFLSLAVRQPGVNAAVVQALLRAGADPNRERGRPLMAATSGERSLMTMLLDAGADPNLLDPSGRRPVFFTALTAPDMLALLLRRGARANAVDGDGWTALMLAVQIYQWEAADALLAAGTDPGHAAPDGTTLRGLLGELRRQTLPGPPPRELLALEARLSQHPQ